MTRKYLPTLSELIDRLSIVQLKEVLIPEHKKDYASEISDICHDIGICISESPNVHKLNQRDRAPINGVVIAEEDLRNMIRAIVVLSQMNLHIWHNESAYRSGKDEGYDLELTHGLNGLRNTAKNKISSLLGGRQDFKIDCLASKFESWQISWEGPDSLLEENPDESPGSSTADDKKKG